MAKTTQPALYHDIEFHFLGGDEDSRLPGTVRIADGAMVLDIRDGYDPYLIEGKQNDSWYVGVNVDHQRRYETEARWASVGQRYVGIWIEGGWEYLFTFVLPPNLQAQKQRA